MPRTTIVIPTYNRARLLPAAIESARGAGESVEIIVVDDASTDETPQTCAALTEVRAVRLARNGGLAVARNAGLAQARGDYVVFLDDDDAFLPGAVNHAVRRLDSDPEAGFYYGQALVANPDGTPSDQVFPQHCPEGDVFWQFLEWAFPAPLCVVARRQCLLDVGAFDKQLRHFEDLDLWVRLSERYQAVADEKPMGIYRPAQIMSGQLSSATSCRAPIGLAVQARLLSLPRAMAAPARRRRLARERFRGRMSDLLLFAARAALAEKATTICRANILTALRIHPRRALRPWTLGLLFRSFL